MRNRCRKCFCMNNNYSNIPINNHKDILETSCNNICCTNLNYNESCNCGFDDDEMDIFPSNPSLGQSYVPIQSMDETFRPCIGLNHGTIFPELVSSYSPGDSMRQNQYLEEVNTIGEGCNANGRR